MNVLELEKENELLKKEIDQWKKMSKALAQCLIKITELNELNFSKYLTLRKILFECDLKENISKCLRT